MKKLMVFILSAAMLANAALAFAQDVYVTKNGKKYHTDQACRWIKNRATTTVDEKVAIEKGYKECGRCEKADKANVQK